MVDPSESRGQNLFGRIAVERGYVSIVQLEQILKLHQQLGGAHPIGSLFVQRGLLSIGQVQEIVALQRQYEQRLASQPAPPRPAAPAATPIATPAPRVAPVAQTAPLIPARPLQPAPAARPLTTPAPVGAGSLLRPIAPTTTPVPAMGAQAPRAPLGAPVAPPMPAPATTPVESTPVEAKPPPLAPLLPTGAKVANRIAAMIEAAEKRGASDIHFHAGTPVVLRIEGRLGVINDAALDPQEQERELMALLTDEQRRLFQELGELDFAFVTPSKLRTRGNIYRAHSGIDATFRVLPRGPQTLEELNLPPQIAKMVGYHQGLVLVTGPASSGKSTTLSALVNLINEDRAEHVLLLEDPIEIVHPQKKALINQRQVGRDTESFARALRGALREDPDVIVIGDLRDRETISLAITAAETGHLVIGSMNTNNAARTVGRIVDAFPPVQQGQVRAMISESLRGVISQKLVLGTSGKRVPAVELLFNTSAMANVIRKGEFFQIRSQMQVGKGAGMRTFDEALREHVLQGRMESEEARKWADNPAFIPNGPASAAPPLPPPQKPGVHVIPSGPAKPGTASVAPERQGLFMPRPGSRS